MTKILSLLLSIFAITAIAGCGNPVTNTRDGDIAICSKSFTEQTILGEMLAQHIEAQTDLTVARRLNLGGTLVCHEALKSGEIDAYIEYTGTAFAAVLQHPPIPDPEKVYQQVKQEYDEKFNLEVMSPLGFNNTYAMIIRGEDARRLKITTLSQAAQYTPEWHGGFGYEFISRQDGYPGLAKTYNLKFSKSPEVMDTGLMYRALVYKKVDMISGDSTNGLIEKLDLVILEDDKNYFPPYEAIPVVRQETLEKYPKLREAIAQLSGNISETEMQQLNYQVDAEFRPVDEVVREFLQSKQLGK